MMERWARERRGGALICSYFAAVSTHRQPSIASSSVPLACTCLLKLFSNAEVGKKDREERRADLSSVTTLSWHRESSKDSYSFPLKRPCGLEGNCVACIGVRKLGKEDGCADPPYLTTFLGHRELSTPFYTFSVMDPCVLDE